MPCTHHEQWHTTVVYAVCQFIYLHIRGYISRHYMCSIGNVELMEFIKLLAVYELYSTHMCLVDLCYGFESVANYAIKLYIPSMHFGRNITTSYAYGVQLFNEFIAITIWFWAFSPPPNQLSPCWWVVKNIVFFLSLSLSLFLNRCHHFVITIFYSFFVLFAL